MFRSFHVFNAILNHVIRAFISHMCNLFVWSQHVNFGQGALLINNLSDNFNKIQILVGFMICGIRIDVPRAALRRQWCRGIQESLLWQCYSIPYIFFNLSGFRILLVTTCPLRGLFVLYRFLRKRCIVILTTTYFLKSNRPLLLMIQSLAKSKDIQSCMSHGTQRLLKPSREEHARILKLRSS